MASVTLRRRKVRNTLGSTDCLLEVDMLDRECKVTRSVTVVTGGIVVYSEYAGDRPLHPGELASICIRLDQYTECELKAMLLGCNDVRIHEQLIHVRAHGFTARPARPVPTREIIAMAHRVVESLQRVAYSAAQTMCSRYNAMSQ